MAQDFGFTGVLGKQAQSRLRKVILVRLWSQKTSQNRVLLNSRSLASARQILTTLKAQRKSGICPRMQLDQDIAEIETQRRALLHDENRLSVKEIVEVYLTQHIEDHTNSNSRVVLGVRKRKGQQT